MDQSSLQEPLGQGLPTAPMDIQRAEVRTEIEAADEATVLKVLQSPQTLRDIATILAQHGITSSRPTLRLDIVAPEEPQLELDAEDLRTLFGSFGPVETVDLLEPRKSAAQIVFGDIVSAFFAQQALHQHYLPTYRAWIHLKWCVDPHDSSQVCCSSYVPRPIPETQLQSFEPQKIPTFHKYTCKFEIQLKDSCGFKVARKLIGPRGGNMKRILKACTVGCVGPVENTLKLRLRGQGSGFLEGPEHAESADPLHLCISSCYYEKYVLAKQLVAELINNVYMDYNQHCKNLGKPPFVVPAIKATENVTTRSVNWDVTQSRAISRQQPQGPKPFVPRPEVNTSASRLHLGLGSTPGESAESERPTVVTSYQNARGQPQLAARHNKPSTGASGYGYGYGYGWTVRKPHDQFTSYRTQDARPYPGLGYNSSRNPN